MFENTREKMEAEIIRRETARLETWLACYALDQRRNPGASLQRMFDACKPALATLRANELGL